MDRLEKLKEILALNPNDSFARYGAAMELAGRGEHEQAIEQFNLLIANDPDYTAGYFMSAQTLAAAGQTQEAIARLQAGVACATRRGDQHAASEMQSLLEELDR